MDHSLFVALKEFLDGARGVVVAFVAFLGALVLLKKEVVRLLPKNPPPPPATSSQPSGQVTTKPASEVAQENQRQKKKPRKHVSRARMLALVFFVIFVGVIVIRAWPDPRRLNEILTWQTWLPFAKAQEQWIAGRRVNAPLFELAITNADLVIDQFSGAATVQEADLAGKPIEVPTGAVSKEERKKIFQNGLVNDLGTCYYIKGRSLEYLGKTSQAKAAYFATTNFAHALTWDPTTREFWSPVQAAKGRLAQMTNAP
jgi:hypothetical protein